MPVSETIFAFPSPRPSTKCPPPKRDEGAGGKDSPVLDMGEASREQGFRLYGCR